MFTGPVSGHATVLALADHLLARLAFRSAGNGKLCLFVNEAVRHMFERDKAGTLSKAAAAWTVIKSKTPASL